MKPTCIPDKLYESQKDVFDAVIAEVIEACAKVCDERGFDPYTEQQCAAAIRARS